MKIYKYLLLLSIFCYSCAQFIPPTGGPKDVQPPQMLSSTPKNQQTNFIGKTISMTFDEWVDISSLNQDLIITPQPKGFYQTKLQGKTLKLTFDKNFEPNTTYTFNFRTGIKDLSERNPAKNLKFVMSTGPKIDSLSITGKIFDINTAKPVFDATVALYVPTDTLNLTKHKPNYFIKTDSSGKYLFENIKNSKYILTAFTDKNGNLIYNEKTELFGYYSDTLNLNKNLNLDTLNIYYANNANPKIRKATARENIFSVQLDKNIQNANIIFDNSKLLYTNKLNLITFFKDENYKSGDTLKTKIIVTDSLLNVDTLSSKVYFLDPPKSASKKKNLQSMSIYSNIKTGDECTNNLLYNLTFDYPITKYDTNKITFKTDTTLYKEKPNYKWISPFNLNITINTKAQKTVELTIPSNTFENFKSDTNAVFTIRNRIVLADKLSSIEGFVQNKTTNKIAQLINADNQKIVQEVKFTNKFNFKNIIPNFYNIKIIEDLNNNGIWDPGNYAKHTKPENIIVTTEPIKVRENFEIKDLEIK